MSAEAIREQADHPVAQNGSASPAGSHEGRELRRLRRIATVAADVTVTGPVVVRGRGEVVIGPGVVLDASVAPIELAAHGGRLEIGAGCYLGPGVSIEAMVGVALGQGTSLGPWSKILDSNHHQTAGDRSRSAPAVPVIVGAGARIGARAIVLPGGAMGDGATLADDSVLSGRVPAGAFVAGVPARLVKSLANGDDPVSVTGRSAGPGELAPFRVVVEDTPTARNSALAWQRGIARLDRGAPDGLRPLVGRADLAAAWLRAQVQLGSATRQGRAYARGSVLVDNRGQLVIGAGCSFAGGPVSSRLVIGPGARLALGHGTVLNFGVVLRADVGISLGERVMLGSRTVIVDRRDGFEGPVVVGDGAWLAHGVTILPGVTIGAGSAVSAGTVVDRDVPAGSLAVGSPLRVRPLSPTTP